MNIQKAQRKRAKIKMGIQGPSGSGKTFSSLLVAHGLCGDWSKIAVVDTENGSADLYAHLGDYNVIGLCVPHSPERYTEAIDTCVKAGMEVVILDSVTHEWEFLLDYHASLPGNSFTNWSKVTPRHNAFVQKILSCTCHIICTVRTKTDYVMTEKNGKQVPEKVGLKSVQRDGLDYEMTLAFDLDIKNNASASKDRTGLFFGKPEQKLTVATGALIKKWCEEGVDQAPVDLSSRISECKNLPELLKLYNQHPDLRETFKAEFEQQKRRIILEHGSTTKLVNQKINLNGTDH
jgi:hypothetical protein